MAETTSILADMFKQNNDLIADYNSKIGYGFENMNTSVNTVSAGVEMFSSLASIYTGFQQLDLAEEEMEMKREQMDVALKEATRARNVVGGLTRNFG